MVSELVEDRERIALVVDDQKDEGLSCVAVLEAGGFVTHHVTDHREALARGRALNPECVVVACALRDAEGFAVLRDLKSYDPRIRVVVVTSIGSIRAAVQAMKLGASDYLPKPVRAEELLYAVDPRRGASPAMGEPENQRRSLARAFSTCSQCSGTRVVTSRRQLACSGSTGNLCNACCAGSHLAPESGPSATRASSTEMSAARPHFPASAEAGSRKFQASRPHD